MSPFSFNNIEFFAVLVPILVAILATKRFGTTVFSWTVVATSLVLFIWLPGLRPGYAGLFLGLSVLVWLAATRAESRWILKVAIALVTLAFIAFRAEVVGWLSFDQEFGSLLPAFGFAFFVVKAYGLLTDVAAGRVKSVTLREVLAYFTFFPTVIAGPIFRYDDFVTQLRAAPALRDTGARIADALPRLLIGAFKVLVVAALIEPWSISSLSPDLISVSVQYVYAGSIAYYFFEYINFSGYSDMAIAVSRMLGLSPPENFDLPFLARNLTELWRRWHMSFASWLRDYLYFPLNFQLAMRFHVRDKRSRSLCGAAAIFLTFLFCGAWHGFAAGTLLFGVLSGTVLAVEALLAGTGWSSGIGSKLQTTGAGRLAHDTVRQVWTLHVAALTFAPVLLSGEQLSALWTLMRRFL